MPSTATCRLGLITVDLVTLQDSQRALQGLGRFDREKGDDLMTALGACNRSGSTGFAAKRDWSTKFEMRSPAWRARPS